MKHNVEVMISEADVAARIAKLGEEITARYQGSDEVVMIGLLRGSCVFLADLCRQTPLPITLDFMTASSYGSGMRSTRDVRILKDLDDDIKGKDVVIVEDIIDSGLTLSWLVSNLEARGAASVEIVAFLRKPDAAKVDVKVAMVGFDIPNEFVVGYGLDYAEDYRTLKGVAILAPSVYN